MPFITATRRLEFDAAHRLLAHEGKCKHLHGHRYALEVTIAARELDSLGRVLDFSTIKDILGGWVDANWDHNTILNPADAELRTLLAKDRAPYVMPSNRFANPTAENMAAVFMIEAQKLITPSIHIERVRLYETPNCYVEAFADDLR